MPYEIWPRRWAIMPLSVLERTLRTHHASSRGLRPRHWAITPANLSTEVERGQNSAADGARCKQTLEWRCRIRPLPRPVAQQQRGSFMTSEVKLCVPPPRLVSAAVPWGGAQAFLGHTALEGDPSRFGKCEADSSELVCRERLCARRTLHSRLFPLT